MANGDDNIPDSPWKRALAATGGFFMGGGLGGGGTEDTNQPQEIPANVKASNRIDDTPSQPRRGGSPQPMSQVDSYPNTEHPFNPAVYPLEQQIEQERGQYQKLAAPPPKPSLAQRIGQVLTSAGTGYMGGAPALQQQADLEQRQALAKQQERQNLAQRIDENQRAVASEGMATQRMQEQERLRAMEEQANWDRMQATLGTRMATAQLGANTREDIAAQQQQGQTTRTNAQIASRDAIATANRAKDMDVARLRAATAGTAKLGQVEQRMKDMAITTLPQITKLKSETMNVSSMLGPAAGRWNDFWTGKVGAPNPQFAHYMDEMGFLDSAITLAHSQGRVSNIIYENFQRMFAAGKQSPENMMQALDVAEEWMSAYANFGNLPAAGGGRAPAPAQAPSQSRVIRID